MKGYGARKVPCSSRKPCKAGLREGSREVGARVQGWGLLQESGSRGGTAEIGGEEAPEARHDGRHVHMFAAHRTFCYLVPTVCQAGIVLGSTHTLSSQCS